MILSQSAPFIIVLSLVLLLSGGVITLVWGRKLPRNGDWIIGIFLLIVAGALILSGKALIDDHGQANFWLRGWIWPARTDGAVMAGAVMDSTGLVFAGLSVLLGAVLLGCRTLLSGQPRLERFYSAVAFATTGAVLCWISLTPWLAFVGIVLVILGGFISLGGSWELNSEAALAIRFACERLFGLMIATIGACGLAGGRLPLSWSFAGQGATTTWLIQSQSTSVAETAGIILLITGIIVQLNPFPFLTWAVSPGRTPAWVRSSLTQIFPALAAMAILLRLQTNLGASEMFTAFGWALFGSTVLAVLSGILQSEWESALGAWFSAGMTLSGAILCFGAPRASMEFLIAVCLGGTAFSCSRFLLHSEEAVETQSAGESNDKDKGNSKAVPSPVGAMTLGFLGILAATGVPGFVSAGAVTEWLGFSWNDPALIAAALVGFGIFALLGWKLLWNMFRQKATRSAHWSWIVLQSILVLLSLGIGWTGTISGGVAPGGVDKVTASLMDILFSSPPVWASEASSLLAACYGVLVVAVLVGYWSDLKIRKPEDEKSLGYRLQSFIVTGYGIDAVTEKFIQALTWCGIQSQRILDQRIWSLWIPGAFSTGIEAVSIGISRADSAVSARVRRIIQQGVDAPARFLQLIQNGDVQWYLILGIGSGMAILLHFLLGAGGAALK